MLAIIAKGGTYAHARIQGDAVPFLDGLGVPVTENGVRWTRTRRAQGRTAASGAVQHLRRTTRGGLDRPRPLPPRRGAGVVGRRRTS